MNRTAILLMTFLTLTGCQVSLGDDDSSDDDLGSALLQPGFDPAANANYLEECDSCHMAYPPGLLPARSWEKIMANLEDHFGENAELEPQINRDLTYYLAEHSADNSPYRRSRKIMRSLAADQVPTRITELSYFKHEHDEIPARLIKDSQEVRSLSNCDACHRQAVKGLFSERQIRIPGYSRWDD